MLSIIAFCSVKVGLFSVFVLAVGTLSGLSKSQIYFSMKWNYNVTAKLNLLMEQLKQDKQ